MNGPLFTCCLEVLTFCKKILKNQHLLIFTKVFANVASNFHENAKIFLFSPSFLPKNSHRNKCSTTMSRERLRRKRWETVGGVGQLCTRLKEIEKRKKGKVNSFLREFEKKIGKKRRRGGDCLACRWT